MICTAHDYIDALDQEAKRQDYFSLALVVLLRQDHTKLIHHCDVDRLQRLSELMTNGGTPVAVLAILRIREHGFFSCMKKFDGAPDSINEMLRHELEIMNLMLRSNEDFRHVTPESEVIQ